MKKIFWTLAVMAVAGVAWAAGSYVERVASIGPGYSASQVTISSAGSGVKNCISDLDVSSDSQSSVVVLDGGATTYMVTISSGGGLVRSWDDQSAICGSAATAMYLNVTAGAFKINYSGFTRK
jgi:hypothetical protein